MKPDRRSGERMSHDDVLALWLEYRETGDVRRRDRLVLTYAPLVKYLVYRKVRELPASCDVEDFISCGLEALMHAIERYDPDKGATLEQFVWTRIHGAILDELRRQDWAPRSVRRWERDINRTREQFVINHGRRPTTPELAEALAVSPEELRAHEGRIASSDLTSLQTLLPGDDRGTVERIETVVSDDRGTDPEAMAAGAEMKSKFRAAFSLLPPREQQVAVLLYVENLKLREIGEVLGVSESRVSQIHSELKGKLRAHLADDTLLFSSTA